MKSYSIGRDESCNILVNDPTQMVSRHHATLNVDGRNITIIDNSSNGTYINGIRISSGTPVPVSRKDVISFAQVTELDWRCIPNESKRNLGIVCAVVVAVLAIGGGTYWYLDTKINQKQNKIESEKAAWTKLGERIETMKQDIAAIATDYESAKDSLSSLKKSLECKDLTGKKSAATAETIKKSFWRIEEALKTVEPEVLRKSLDSAVQSYGDRAESTESRVTDLETKVKTCKGTLEKISKDIKETAANLASLNEKPKAQKPKEEKKEEKKQEIIIVGM